jgi:hypothetical protein
MGAVNGDANRSQLQAASGYQYGAFHEAFIHIGRYSGHCRWPDDASLRIDMCGGLGSFDGDATFT